jgi:hypothetical protein
MVSFAAALLRIVRKSPEAFAQLVPEPKPVGFTYFLTADAGRSKMLNRVAKMDIFIVKNLCMLNLRHHIKDVTSSALRKI